jgi:hypothetical protein
LSERIRSDLAAWGRVVKAAGLSIE